MPFSAVLEVAPTYNATMNHIRICHLMSMLVIVGAALADAAEHTPDSLAKVRDNLDQKKAVLIDVREPGEWKQGHLAEAQLVPLSDIRRLAKDANLRTRYEPHLPKDQIIYCHCGSGVRVISAAHFLQLLGYDIRPLAAGYADLLEAGFRQAAKAQ
jgi:phage shock protein E